MQVAAAVQLPTGVCSRLLKEHHATLNTVPPIVWHYTITSFYESPFVTMRRIGIVSDDVLILGGLGSLAVMLARKQG